MSNSLYSSAAEAEAARNEREAMVDRAREVGLAQVRTRNAPPVLPAPRDLSALVPPEHAHDPEGYIRAMTEKGSRHTDNVPHVVSSDSLAALPIDPNILASCRSGPGVSLVWPTPSAKAAPGS